MYSNSSKGPVPSPLPNHNPARSELPDQARTPIESPALSDIIESIDVKILNQDI